MPQVPGLTPTVQPEGYAPEVNLPVPVDAFGGAIGHALEGLGNQVEQSSDRIWARAMEMQGLKNETEAKEADAKYMMQSGVMHADFVNKEGLNAGPEALKKHIQDLQDLRVGIRGTLSNPAAQRMYDGSSLGFMGRNIFNAAGHSGQQMKVAANNAASSRIDLATTSMGDSPTDPIAVGRGRAVIRSEVDRQGELNGWAPEQIEATKAQKLSVATAHQITNIAKNNALGAQSMLDDAVQNKAIRPEEAEKVQATVTTQTRLQGSRIVSDTVLGDRRQGEEENVPAQEYIDRGMKLIDTDPRFKSAAKNDPLFKDFARERLTTDYNRQHAIETDADNMNVRTIGQAMMKANQEGSRPTTVEELLTIDPNVGPAWDSISRNPRLQQSFLRTLEHNATQPHIPVTPENLRQYHAAIGRADGGTQEQQAEFMAHDWANEKDLTYSQRSQLMSEQQRKQTAAAKNVDADPRVGRAMGLLQQETFNAEISKSKSPDDYFAFRGALQSELMQFQQDNKRAPKPEEVIEMGKNLIKAQTIKGAGWFGMSADVPVYKLPITDEEKAPVVQDYTNKFGRPPNAATVERIIRAQHYNKYYSGTQGSK